MKKFLASLLLMVFMIPLALQANGEGNLKSRFFYDFNDYSIAGWKTVDYDNDGFCWLIHEDGYIYSESSELLKPNNIFATTSKYSIYPTSKISFDVRPLDTEKSVEKYGIGIAYSLDGISYLSLQDETVLESPAEWNKVEISLEYLAGKDVYLGILHHTYDDQGTILVDNIKLTDGLLNSAKDVVAAENGNNINITWAWDDEDAKQEPCGYRVYRAKEDGNTVMIANDITSTSYQDTEWENQEWGIYKWGVAALYEQQTRGGFETLLEEGFETTEYPNIPEGWTNLSIPASTSLLGPWMASEAITTIIAPNSGDKLAFSYGSSDDADFYLITPAIDLTKATEVELTFSYAAPGIFENPGNPLHVKYSESLTGPWTELWYEQSNFIWKDVTLDLNACSGKIIYIAFVHEDTKGSGNFGIGIDNISVKAQISEAAVPVASKITWSNTLEKDMFTNVYINVTTDNGNPVYGALATLQNINEPTYKYELTADSDGDIQAEVRRGTYKYSISLDGYYPLEGNVEVLDVTSLNIVLESLPELVEGLYVSPTAWAMWDFEGENITYDIKLNDVLVAENISEKYYQHDESSLAKGKTYKTTVLPKGQTEKVMMEYTWYYSGCSEFASAVNFKAKKNDNEATLTWTMPIYEEVLDPVYSFSVNFDNGTLEGWTTIDADGDKRNWLNTSEFANEGFGYNNTFCVTSVSYDTEYGAFDPDNFLISDQKYTITESSRLTYLVSAQSKDYPAEHYGIAISTKSNNKVEDFEIIFDETLEAGEVEAGSIQGQWFEKTINLSEYAGKDVYIAFRHYNSKDNSWLKVDNISLEQSSTRGTASEKGDWLYYDNGAYLESAGNYDANTMTPTQIYWAIMFPSDLIYEYAGRMISKVAIFDYSAHKGSFSIHEGGNDAPGNMIHVQSYETKGKKTFIEIELDTPIKISGEENVWIQFSNEFGSGLYPAAYSEDMGDPNSRWRSNNGSLWYDSEWHGEGWYGSWMIRAFVDEKDESVIEDPKVSMVEPIGAIIYRDGELITPEPIKETTYTDIIDENVDEHKYTLRVVYGGDKDESYYAMSCPVTTTLLTKEPLACDAPQNLHGETTLNADGTFGATLIWPYTNEWIHYDDGDILEDKCIGTGGSMHWGIMFPAKDIEQYLGLSITEISLFDIEPCDATLVISYGNDFGPELTIHQQDFSFSGTKDFFSIKTTAPIPIIDEGNLWITITNINGKYPAAVTKNTGNPNGRWCSMDGKTWSDLYAMNPELNFTWYLRAFVTSGNNRGSDGTLDHYNIYRSTNNSNYELISTTTANTYFDEIERGIYYYQVTAVYKRGDETCESEPASSYSNPEENYVVVEVTEIDENGVKGMMVYPNPAKDMLNITAENMRRITISNVLGQVVYDRNVNSDNEIINMSQYEAGIYMVRIATENGVAVKRISVAK